MKSKVIISLFQIVRLSLSIFTVCKSNWYVSEITSCTFAHYLDTDDVTYRANVA